MALDLIGKANDAAAEGLDGTRPSEAPLSQSIDPPSWLPACETPCVAFDVERGWLLET